MGYSFADQVSPKVKTDWACAGHFTPAQPLAFPRICFECGPVSGRDRAFGRVSAGSRTARDAFSADECGDRSIILGLRNDQYPSRSDFRRGSQKLGTHLEIPTKIL